MLRKRTISPLISDEILRSWQDMVDVLASLLNIPAGLVMRLNDPYIEVFVSSKSEGNPYHPGDREHVWGSGLYCETVLKTKAKLLVPDAHEDENWKNNPDIKLNMISYLGFPIQYPDGEPFGTLCILDNKKNTFSEKIERLMTQFRNFIQSQLEQVYMNAQLGDNNRRLTDYLRELQALRGLVPICAHCKSIRDKEGKWKPIERVLIQHPEADFSHGICPECMKKHWPSENEIEG